MGKRARCKTPTVGEESEWEALSPGQRSDGIMVDDGSVADADAAKVVPWWSAARCLRRALAAAPRWRRRRPPAAGAEAAEVGGVVVEEEGEGGDSSWSLMVDLPSLDRIVKETVSPATSSSSNKLKIFWNSGFISNPDI